MEDKYKIIVDPMVKQFFKNGLWHRDNGPAVEYKNGDKYWCKEGEYHRVDGPAIELNNGIKYWFYEGKSILCSSKEEFERIINLQLFW